jgi:ribosome-binding ATPase YchF (GTP1/OBG family)
MNLLTIKPVLYTANVSEDGFSDNPHLDVIEKFAEAEGAEVVAICANIEVDIADMEADEKLIHIYAKVSKY